MLYIYLLNLAAPSRAPSGIVEGACSLPERTFQAFLWQEVPGSEALHLETPSSSLYCCQGQKMNFLVIIFLSVYNFGGGLGIPSQWELFIREMRDF